MSRLSVVILAGLAVSPAISALPANAASEAVIYAFRGGPNGEAPYAPLIKIHSKLYGTTLTTVFSLMTTGKEKRLHAFKGGSHDGQDVEAGLTEFRGILYGLSLAGGPGQANLTGGTVFSVTPQGAYSVLYDFSRVSGYGPRDKLTALGDMLYGTTQSGGGIKDVGSMFSLTPQGAVNILYRFGNSDGAPSSALIGLGGVFYGTTRAGGTASLGTLYQITTAGVHTVVHSFRGGSDGNYPGGDLVDVAGTLYGTTFFGGTGGCNPGTSFAGCGTIFSVTPKGAEKILYSFPQHAMPTSLIYVDGLFYGTTYYGGGTGCGGAGCGTVFSFTPQGVYTTLYAFQGGSDGSNPNAALLDVGGVLYGTTVTGGNGGCRKQVGCGTVFKVIP